MVECLKEVLSLEVQRPTYIIMDAEGVAGKPRRDVRRHTEGKQEV